MTPDEILSYPPRVLTQAQRELYFDQGYLQVERFVGEDWLARLRAATAEIIDRSRSLTASNDMLVLEPDHAADSPRLRRLCCAADHHPTYWEYASKSRHADLVGSDVKFRECMINFKWAGSGDEVSWHQDIPFHPHTNMTPLNTLLCLEDVTPDMGPLMLIPGSHKGELFDHYDTAGAWAGRISDADLKRVPVEEAVAVTGPAGSLTVTHGCMIHASERSHSDRNRPLLICGYSSADAFCYTTIEYVSRYIWQIVRGEPAKFAHHDPVRLRLPPDLSGRYASNFEDRQGEERPNPYGG